MSSAEYVLATSCPDRSGIVAAISGFVAEAGGSITEAAHFVDDKSGYSFMRTAFTGSDLPGRDALALRFAPTGTEFSMHWQLHDAARRCRVLIAVSKQGHVLNNMLHRYSIGTLPIDITGVVSNHDDMRGLVEWHGLPYHRLPGEAGDKPLREKHLMQLFKDSRADLLALARYMQILSDGFCNQLPQQIVNIHHSFLPGFKGAKPYHQAHERGVKIIGATAHYVTEDLDEGPIIEQGVERVDHSMGPDEMVKIGHDLESVVFNRAVRWFAEHRVFLNGRRTVILRA